MKRFALIALALLACGGSSRFALRPPVLHEHDDAPLARAPAKDEPSDVGTATDILLLRPLSSLFAFRRTHEARNVNALDEVPDSTWYENRDVPASAVTLGACPAFDPAPPFHIKSTKVGGVTPGLVVTDKNKHKYVLKLDELSKYNQPEISTAADAIVSRLYWAIGFNVPCNNVIDVALSDLELDEHSVQVDTVGRKKVLTREKLTQLMKQATRAPSGKMRMSASLFIPGEGVGFWRTEGVRPHDPNDVVPHEDRRELRGERYLAAWTAHWDSRIGNTFDTFIKTPGGGHIVHYFIDFSDTLGGTISRTEWPEPRAGFETVVSFDNAVVDMIGFGFIRRAWDDVEVNPRFPDLGFLDTKHFDPDGFQPQTPLTRFAIAQPADLAWMARRLATIGVDHVRAAAHAGKLSKPGEEDELVRLMMGRRDIILRRSFSRVSPLGDVAMRDGRVCFVDFARTSGVARDEDTHYAAEVRTGPRLRFMPIAPRIERDDRGLCVELPASFAPRAAPRESPERYLVVDVVRYEHHDRTRIRAHFYDLGPAGYALVGLERL
jgi:hypothetical protein